MNYELITRIDADAIPEDTAAIESFLDATEFILVQELDGAYLLLKPTPTQSEIQQSQQLGTDNPPTGVGYDSLPNRPGDPGPSIIDDELLDHDTAIDELLDRDERGRRPLGGATDA